MTMQGPENSMGRGALRVALTGTMHAIECVPAPVVAGPTRI